MQKQPRFDSSGQPQPYEVRCHRCRCSFAPGTKQCLHCGGPLGQPPFVLAAGPPGAADEEAAPTTPSFARGVLWLISAGVAVALSALQTCSER
jgi:hypothetical protein